MNDTIKFWQDLKSGRFVSMVKESAKGKRLSNSQEVYNVLKPMLAEEDDVEKVYIIFLDAQNKILAIEKLFSGSITAASIYPREIVKRIIHLKASAFVMAHNHPSMDTTPSAEDKTITIKIGIAAATIDVAFHDHIIIGDGYHSMADTGWLKQVSSRFSNLLKSEPQAKEVAMTKDQKEIYQDTAKLRQLLKRLNGEKFRLDCGYHVTFGHSLGNDITIYKGNRFKIICSQCGY